VTNRSIHKMCAVDWDPVGGRIFLCGLYLVNARDKPSITGHSTFAMNPHPLWLSIDNPAPPPHRIVLDIEQLFECLTGIDTGFIFSSLGLVCFSGRRRVGILFFLSVKWIRSPLEDTILDTMGNKVAVYLCPFDDCVVVVVAICLELRTRGCDVRARV